MKSDSQGLLGGVVRFSLRFKGIIIALACAFLINGFYSVLKAKYDVFPEFAPPQIVIQTQAVGLSPEQVETLVTLPIENAINGVAGIESLRSSSIQGVSVITAMFQIGTDIFRDRQAVAERLSTLAGKLPQGVQAPIMVPLTSSTGDLLTIGIVSKKRSLMELRTIADWTIKQRLLAVPGVSKVAVFGGEIKQLQIQINPNQLSQYNLSVDDVLNVARRATGVRGAGFVDNGNQRIILQTEGQFINPEELARSIFVSGSNNNVTLNVALGDVAKVTVAPDLPISAASIMGEPGVVLNVWAQYGANTLEATKEVERALDDLRPLLSEQSVDLYPSLFRAANFIEKATYNLKTSLWLGSVLVIAVLFLFLFNLRTASISVTAIPLSLLAAVSVMEYCGFTLNTMTLGGLAIAIGEVVDDAVIDVENILRRLRENAYSNNPKNLFRVVLDASIEVRSAVVYATFAVILVFIPVLTMSGLAGRLFAPLGVAYILAILSSLIVALTITPALCFVLLGKSSLQEKEPAFLRWLKEKYRSLLLRIQKYPTTVTKGVVILTLLGVAALPFLRAEFLPELREGHFLVHVMAIPGTSIEESLRIGRQISLELLKIPYVRFVAQRVGRSEIDDVFGSHASEFEVDLKSLTREQSERAVSQIRDVSAKFIGINFTVNTFLTERIEETISGYTASVILNLVGNDLDKLDQKAEEVSRVLSKIRGAADIQVQSPSGIPQLAIRLRQDDLRKWGFDPVDVLEVIRTAYQGNIVGQIYDGNRVFDVSVILEPKFRKTITDVGELLLRNPAGIYVRLRQLADIEQTSGRYVVLHNGARRIQAVTCNVSGRGVDSFVNEAKKKIHALVSFPSGMYLEFTGTAEAQRKSRRDLIMHSILSGLGIILLLGVVLKNYRNVSLVLMNLPFAFVGGVIAILLTGGEMSIGSMVGFVTLFGITMRNSIMMISHFDHLIASEGKTWGFDVALQGASERLAPILMTALVTALGLFPLAIGSGTAGREIEGPMAIVILGGLATSTALNLLVLPMLSVRYGRFETRELLQEK